MAPSLYLTNGELSAYGLACGYLEQSPDNGNGDSVELRHDGCYHVHIREAGVTVDSETRIPFWIDSDEGSKIRADWHTFDTLTEARRFYRSESRRLSKI